MSKYKSILLTIIGIMFFLISIFSCSQEFENMNTSVFLDVLFQQEKSLNSEIDLIPVKYQYLAENNDENLQDNTWVNVNIENKNDFKIIKIPNIQPGNWTFFLRAYNSSEKLIYQGKLNVNVSDNNNSFQIYMVRVDSNSMGSLSFSVEVPLYKNKIPVVCARYRKIGEKNFINNSSFASYENIDYKNEVILIKGNIENIPEGVYELSLNCLYEGKTVGGDFVLADVIGFKTTYITGKIDGLLTADKIEIGVSIKDFLPYVWDSDKIIIGFYDDFNNRELDLINDKKYYVRSYFENMKDIKNLGEIGIRAVYADENTDLSIQKMIIIGSNVTNLKSSIDKGWFGNSYMSSAVNETLEELYINQNITEGALMQLRGLKKLILGSSDKFNVIDSGILSGCFNLKSIIIPKNITNIKTEAFAQCGIKTIYCRIKSMEEPLTWENGWDKGIINVVWNYTGD